MGYSVFAVFVLILQGLFFAVAEPVQYCRFGHDSAAVDFCMGVTMHENHTSDAYDLYLSFTVTRSSNLGWTAIGTGPTMSDSLMFIVYGDPTSGRDPILSIRTVNGHTQPRQVMPQDMGRSDIRVLQAMWLPNKDYGPAQHVAKMSVVCYGCTHWPGFPISATSTSQPWIWAWNEKQEFAVYSFDAELEMHRHHAGNGGWGVFYIDMARSVSKAVRRPSIPPLRPQLATLGSSDAPIGLTGLMASLRAAPVLVAHGVAMSLAFLVLIPLGVVAIRSRSSKAFEYHTTIQLLAIITLIGGSIAGFMMSRGRLSTPHQIVGVSLGCMILLQAMLGWWHHKIFLRIKRRTWVSHVHIWVGRSILLFGGCNVISGMMLAGQSRPIIYLASGLVASEMLGLCMWLWLRVK